MATTRPAVVHCVSSLRSLCFAVKLLSEYVIQDLGLKFHIWTPYLLQQVHVATRSKEVILHASNDTFKTHAVGGHGSLKMSVCTCSLTSNLSVTPKPI